MKGGIFPFWFMYEGGTETDSCWYANLGIKIYHERRHFIHQNAWFTSDDQALY